MFSQHQKLSPRQLQHLFMYNSALIEGCVTGKFAGHCYKTFLFIHNLKMRQISQSVYPQQAFPALPKVCK